MNKPKKDLNANEQLILKKEKERARQRLEQKIREFIILLFVLAVFVGGGSYFLSEFISNRYEDLQYIKKLNRTTLEISQLIDNIRNAYLLHTDEPSQNLDNLIKMGAIPERLVHKDRKGQYLLNPFGGKIEIVPSYVIYNKAGTLSSPTFKMSYQGLSRRACIDLAMLDWGDSLKGLLAVAIGSVDARTGEDSALEEIDETPERKKAKEQKAAGDNMFFRSSRMQYQMNVARPNDKFMPTPFSQGSAESGCFCGYKDCSFALHYAIFSVGDDK